MSQFKTGDVVCLKMSPIVEMMVGECYTQPPKATMEVSYTILVPCFWLTSGKECEFAWFPVKCLKKIRGVEEE